MALTDDYRNRIAAACRRGSGLPRAPRAPRACAAPYERIEQAKLANWLDGRQILWCHPANEGARSGRFGASLKQQGLKRGVPDVLIFTRPPRGDYCGVAIELKRADGSGRVSPEQREWLDGLARAGWCVFVAHGWEAAVRVLVHDLGYSGPAPEGTTGMVEMIA